MFLNLSFFFLNSLFTLFIYLFIYFWLCWVFVSVRGLSPVAASGGHSSLRCAGLSLSWPLLLRSTGSRRAGSVIVAHGASCSAACGIFPDQGSNPCPLHWQADSQPLRHQGSPGFCLFVCFRIKINKHQNDKIKSGLSFTCQAIDHHSSRRSDLHFECLHEVRASPLVYLCQSSGQKFNLTICIYNFVSFHLTSLLL